MRAIAYLFAAAAVVMSTSAPAFAHAMLLTSDPAAGATLTAAPAQIVLNFSEALEGRFSSITLVDAAGRTLQGELHVAGHTMALGVGRLLPGVFEVRWRALSVDSHVTQGAYRFTVAGP